MAKQRASLFDGGDTQELDVASFAPKTSADVQAPKAEQVRAVTQAAQFISREPALPKSAAKAKRPQRRYRTGRNVQLNAKVLQETRDLLYEITDAHEGWVLGYTLQRALDALQRELKKPG
jgi:hypothetical protein